MKKFHIAIAVSNVQESIVDYSKRLNCVPQVVVTGEYALWRTDFLNFSIRKTNEVAPGTVRHLGWEDSAATEFTKEKDVNGIVWEHFSAAGQQAEILAIWPDKSGDHGLNQTYDK